MKKIFAFIFVLITSVSVFAVININNFINKNDSKYQTFTIGLSPDLGGYIFWVSEDGKHGLVAEIKDQGFSDWYGAQDLISNPANHSSDGAKFRDWRLPTKHELNEIYTHKAKIGGFTNKYYWCSTEHASLRAWFFDIITGETYSFSKDKSNCIRAVRSF